MKRKNLLNNSKRIFKAFAKRSSLVVIICFFVFFLIPGIFKQGKMQNRFGFIVTTPYIGRRVDRCEVIMVISANKNGAFYKAGIRNGDILIDTSYFWLQDYWKCYI